jgi:hypothetical protein
MWAGGVLEVSDPCVAPIGFNEFSQFLFVPRQFGD